MIKKRMKKRMKSMTKVLGIQTKKMMSTKKANGDQLVRQNNSNRSGQIGNALNVPNVDPRAFLSHVGRTHSIGFHVL